MSRKLKYTFGQDGFSKQCDVSYNVGYTIDQFK